MAQTLFRRNHGGGILVRGRAESALAGNLDHEGVAVVRFPDMASLKRWFHSDAYQNIIALRDEASDMTIVTYEVTQ